MPIEDWVQHSKVDRFLYDWQTLITGLAAIVAALIAVFGAEFFAWLRARREDKAVRASLAVEIRSLLNILIDTHQILTLMEFPTGRASCQRPSLLDRPCIRRQRTGLER